MGLKIRHLIQNQGVLGVCRLLINPASQELRGIVKIVSFKTTNFWVSQSPPSVWQNETKSPFKSSAMKFSDSLTLQGKHASLVPLTMAHHYGLCEAVKDGELWKLWYTSIPSPEAMAKEIDRRLGLQKLGSMNPFCVLDASGTPVGMTTYMNIDQENRRLEIGSTWYRQSVQRTAINTECKLLLLRHAFTKLDCIAVEFRTHFFNHQSRRGIERLGAKLDGVLRSHQINRHPDAKASIRDTCVYSILADEFPVVDANLSFRLSIPSL
jgi:RimJ/RimL family protein N-acetyltransferase